MPPGPKFKKVGGAVAPKSKKICLEIQKWPLARNLKNVECSCLEIKKLKII
jgi:hypothetical protein